MPSGGFTPYHRIMHGCTLKDGIYHTITRTEGPVIYEVDGRPVVELVDEMYESRDRRTQVPVKCLTIGVNYGEKYGLRALYRLCRKGREPVGNPHGRGGGGPEVMQPKRRTAVRFLFRG
jgi:hypothetical protein